MAFGFDFGKNKEKTKTSNNQTLDPWTQGRIEDYSKRIESMIPQAQAYGGPLNVGPNAWQTQAGQMAGSLWDYKPGQVSAQKFTDADLSGYMDKGLEGNIQRTLQGVERGRQVQQVADNQAATNAKAFGGSRHAVADIGTNEAFGRIAADKEDAMRSAAFDKAASLWGADRAAQMGADQFNAQLGLQGRQLGLAGAGMLADLGGQLNQLDAGNIARNYAEFARMQGVPYQNIGVLQSLLGMTPTLVDSQGTSKTTGYQLRGGWQSGGGGGGAGGGGGGFDPSSIFSSAGGGGGASAGMDPATASAAWAAMMSDRRAKEDVSFVETDAKGRRWYDFRYIGDPARTVHRGVMAQDLLEADPNHPAVTTGEDGFYRVNYGAL